MLVFRDGWRYFVEAKEKAPTKRGCFSIRAKQLDDARIVSEESGTDYAFVVRNTDVTAKNNSDVDPWVVTFPFNGDWLKPTDLQRYENLYFIPTSAFQPLMPTLKYGPPSAYCLI